MGEQNAVILYLIRSTTLLWVIVICLLAIQIRGMLRRRSRLNAQVLDDSGRIREEYALVKQKEILIGKSTPENLVHIDFSGSRYAGTIQEDHAAFERHGDSWYVRSRAEGGLVGLKQSGGDTVYKLKRNIPYQIHRGDIVYISYEKIVIQ